MKIQSREIGEKNTPLIIAEIGINHGGCLDTAKNLVLAARNAGAECVKHQTHIVEDEMTEEALNVYPGNDPRSIYEVIAQSALGKDDEIQLKQYVEDLGMIYLSTPFSRAAADFLEDIGACAYKIGSGECDNYPLVKHIASFGKPIIMSTGMNSIESTRASVEIIKDAGCDFALLQCTNLYPSPPETVSLKGISELRSAFPEAVIGFSDHSIGPYMGLAAIANGACLLERHFTDSRYRKGPDISCSMDPAELSLIVRTSGEIWQALQNNKGLRGDEKVTYNFARASVVADRDLPEGAILREGDLWVRRPGNGELAPKHMETLYGMKLKKSLRKNEQLKWEFLSES